MENFFLVLQVLHKSERLFGTRILDVSLAKKSFVIYFIKKKLRNVIGKFFLNLVLYTLEQFKRNCSNS